MITSRIIIPLVGLFFLTVTAVIAEDTHDAEHVRKLLLPLINPIKVQEKNADKLTTNLVNLGRTLFYDQRLSENGTYSCNSCHDLTKYGTGGDYFLKQVEQNQVFRDVPGLYNLSDQKLFGWIGQYNKLTDKIEHSLVSEYEMNVTNSDEMIKRLTDIPAYKNLFTQSLPEDNNAISLGNISIALQAFINGLITPAPIDKFLSGDDQALSEKQRKGAISFDRNNCFACHTGSPIGGQLIMKLGVLQPWPNQEDKGYYEVSKNPDHKLAFRVASLRNAEKTAPYFHDRSSKRLWDAVRKMAHFELGIQLDLEEIDYIQEFIKSLSGDISQEYIKAPQLPQ